MKKALLISLLVLFLGAGIAVGGYFGITYFTQQKQPQTPSEPPADPNNPIKSVKIKFLNLPASGRYTDGDQVRVQAQVEPTNLTGLTYKWERIHANNSSPLGNQKELTFNVSASDDNMELKLTVKKENYTLAHRARISVNPRPSVPQLDIIDKVNQAITENRISIKNPNINETDFNNINERTILNLINISTINDNEKSQLTVINIVKSKPNIRFNVRDNKGKNSQTINLRWNITSNPTPPSPTETLIQRVNKVISQINPMNSNISEADFNAITSSNILDKIYIPNISASEKRQLTVINFSKRSPTISFNVTNNGQTSNLITVRWNVTSNPTPPSPNLEITGVSLSLANPNQIHRPGDTLNFNASVTPSSITTNLKYEWILDGTIIKITTTGSFSYQVKTADNLKPFKVRVTHSINNKQVVKESSVITLRVEETLIQKVNKVITQIKPVTTNINEADFNAITSSNILDKINIPNINPSEKRQLSVINFKKADPNISFNVTNGGETSNLITVTWTVDKPIPPGEMRIDFTGDSRYPGKNRGVYGVGDTIRMIAKANLPTGSTNIEYEWAAYYFRNQVFEPQLIQARSPSPELNYLIQKKTSSAPFYIAARVYYTYNNQNEIIQMTQEQWLEVITRDSNQGVLVHFDIEQNVFDRIINSILKEIKEQYGPNQQGFPDLGKLTLIDPSPEMLEFSFTRGIVHMKIRTKFHAEKDPANSYRIGLHTFDFDLSLPEKYLWEYDITKIKETVVAVKRSFLTIDANNREQLLETETDYITPASAHKTFFCYANEGHPDCNE